MKQAPIYIFSLLFIQASASFFDEFRGALSNVERGFGKLLNDVVIDVKDTLHCTISAVEEVLALNGLLDERSDYNYRCRGVSQANIPNVPDHRHRVFFEERLQFNQPNLQPPEYTLEHISQELENSINNVNKSINDILGRREANGNLNSMSELLQDETDRLNEVSDLLRRELENISVNVRSEIAKQNMNYKKNPRDTIWDDLNVLHDMKEKSKNETEINEINHIIDRVVDELNVTSNQKELSETEKLEGIRKKLNKYSEGKQNNVHDDISVWNTKEMTHNKDTDKQIGAFEDFAQKTLEKNNIQRVDNNIEEILKQETTQHNSDKSLFNAYMATDSSSPFYDPNSKTDTKEIVDDAKKILEESIESENLINSFFNEQKSSGVDMFSNTGMLNFG
ncbi:uncharacterized protein LOC116766797 [Danaus plexippus]|uniref:uncharacterized protein LOC116766797 n=1 Tax=Danaus plexippus TaxID=13037 RepID=UPI002AB1FB91|nr:uncharacterized protein LOC116766797 [Danaus plexippus]